MRRKVAEENPFAAHIGTANDLPPLSALLAFEAVARIGSMRGAAADVGVSHTVISRHMKNLEKWLGVKVLVSSARGIELTHEGKIYSQKLKTAFFLIAEATAGLRSEPAGKFLRIWCVSGLATYWLTPRLHALQSILPDTEIILRPYERAPGFNQVTADVIIGYTGPQNVPSGATTLATPRMFPVASPKWLSQQEDLDIHTLAQATLLHEEDRQRWSHWLDQAGLANLAPNGMILWDASLCMDAAVAGQGVALASTLTAQPLILQGKLLELFDTDIKLGSYYFQASPRQARTATAQKFLAWLQDQLRSTEQESALAGTR